MAKINNPPPRTPIWPWGSTPQQVRSRMVDRDQLVDKTGRKKKKGDPKNPALPSAALLDSIGPAHNADELRLPQPPMPQGHDADLANYGDRPHLAEAATKLDPEERRAIDRNLTRLNAPPERVERLKALLNREAMMLQIVSRLSDDVEEIQRRMREEQSEGKF